MEDNMLLNKELGEKLKKIYKDAEKDKASSLVYRVFLFKYAKYILDNSIDPKKILEEAGLLSLYPEVTKFVGLYDALRKNTYGVSFADFIPDMIDAKTGEQASHPDFPKAEITKSIDEYLKAIKAKPFLILGGFSGTGKSQSVKELAYLTCPDINGLQKDKLMPGNYCLISVKPNWHDSSDLLGYYSSLNDKYELTDFVRFLVKAMQNPTVPFFACIDEMNLAPVEEYFAEYLSVLESRSYNPNTEKIESAPLLTNKVFTDNYNDFNIFKELGIEENSPIAALLKLKGLCLPDNVVVIGTVNMDDTTHSFSRKVIDRAMTFETNIIDFTKDVYNKGDNMHYVYDPKEAKNVLPKYASAKDALNALKANGVDTERLLEVVTGFINSINTALKGSPFQVSYRVLNETILYYHSYNDGKEVDNIQKIFNNILMMKVLPRIEGDQDKAQSALTNLLNLLNDEAYADSRQKISEMLKPFNDGGSGFTTFWN